MKKILFLILSFLVLPAYCYVVPIDAENNAYFHNNCGVNWLKEGYYYGAIREFNIAIQLNPNTQATALYYKNLGETYEKINYNNLAQTCYERSLMQNPMNFDTYLSLVRTLKAQRKLKEKLNEYINKSKKDPLAKVMVGVIYYEMGNKKTSFLWLKQFVNAEPDLILTRGVKSFIKKNTPTKTTFY